MNFRGLRLSGFPGWVVWAFVHLSLPDRVRQPADDPPQMDPFLHRPGSTGARVQRDAHRRRSQSSPEVRAAVQPNPLPVYRQRLAQEANGAPPGPASAGLTGQGPPGSASAAPARPAATDGPAKARWAGALAFDAALPAHLGRSEQHLDTEAKDSQIGDHLDDHDDAGRLGLGGDVAVAHRRKRGDREVQGIGPGHLLGEAGGGWRAPSGSTRSRRAEGRGGRSWRAPRWPGRPGSQR